MTKVQAIKKLMEDNEGLASLSLIYKSIEEYYPNAKKSKHWEAGLRGVLYREINNNKTFKKIDNALFSLVNFKEEEYLKDEIILSTERTVEIKSRIGQSFFRKSLLKSIKKCPFTNISNKSLLIASHIKPWANSDDNERLDMNNGFLFTPTYDILFDKGYISFKNDKSLIISASLDKNTIKALNLIENDRIKLLPIENRELYLEYHRDIILKKVG